MERLRLLILMVVVAALASACAAAPKVKYVTEAEAVTVAALEPVFVESVELGKDIEARVPKALTGGDGAETLKREFEQIIQKNIRNTNRFRDVMLSIATGDSYSIVPRIDEAREFYQDVAGDPTRKMIGVTARVHMDVFLYTRQGEKKLMASFADERTKEGRVKASGTPPSTPEMKPYYEKAIGVAFASASDKLGSRFNPSYELGEITKIDGDIGYVRMNTSLFRDMPSKDQSVDVVDSDGFKVAHMEPIDIQEGLVVGKLYTVAGKSVSVGMKTQARVNRLQ